MKIKITIIAVLLGMFLGNTGLCLDDNPMNLKYTATVSISSEKAVNLSEIFKILGDQSKINFILDEKVNKDKMSMCSFENIPFPKLLDTILKMNDLSAKKIDENSIIVFPLSRQAIYDEQYTYVYKCNFIEVNEAAGIIQNTLAGQNPSGFVMLKISPNRNAKQLVISAPKTTIDKAIELLKQIDVNPEAEKSEQKITIRVDIFKASYYKGASETLKNKEVEKLLEKIKPMFLYEDYRFIDTLIINGVLNEPIRHNHNGDKEFYGMNFKAEKKGAQYKLSFSSDYARTNAPGNNQISTALLLKNKEMSIVGNGGIDDGSALIYLITVSE